MCLQPGEEIGNEVHANVDQFFRLERGKAKFVFNGKVEHLVGDEMQSWFRPEPSTT